MKLTTEQLATRVDQWAAEALGINTVEHEPDSLANALPLVVSAIKRDGRTSADPSLPGLGAYQQTYVRYRGVEMLLLVTPEPTWDATKLLYGYVDTLAESILRDRTLGGRVHTTSPLYEAGYDPPEVQYQDGTVARAATMTITIGEVTEV